MEVDWTEGRTIKGKKELVGMEGKGLQLCVQLGLAGCRSHIPPSIGLSWSSAQLCWLSG
ncbi:hypothetical protein [Paenibacillus sp. FSL K6-1558]|uniref:hypothetical protein n=1 Tax=Paenibacillus sp. FSL K6-1558 TaxID=2921473 RepID=UPI00280A6027|nr:MULTISPECIES: hypothetical protein [Paenibacillus]